MPKDLFPTCYNCYPEQCTRMKPQGQISTFNVKYKYQRCSVCNSRSTKDLITIGHQGASCKILSLVQQKSTL